MSCGAYIKKANQPCEKSHHSSGKITILGGVRQTTFVNESKWQRAVAIYEDYNFSHWSYMLTHDGGFLATIFFKAG